MSTRAATQDVLRPQATGSRTGCLDGRWRVRRSSFDCFEQSGPFSASAITSWSRAMTTCARYSSTIGRFAFPTRQTRHHHGQSAVLPKHGRHAGLPPRHRRHAQSGRCGHDIAERLVPAGRAACAAHCRRRRTAGLKWWTRWCDGSPSRCWAHISGYPTRPDGDLRVWATRLFEFQFVGSWITIQHCGAKSMVLRPTCELISKASWTSAGRPGRVMDDVLGRCLVKQAAKEPGFSTTTRSAPRSWALSSVGPPQPPMVVPQALEQLLRRPDALAGAQQAARSNDDKLLAGYVFEAMRFDPLAPALPRVATRASTSPLERGAPPRSRGRHGLRRVQLGHDGRKAPA